MSRIDRTRSLVGCLKSLAALAVAAGALALAPQVTAHEDQMKAPKLPPELASLRAAMEKYKDPIAAVHDGYLSTVGCVEYPDGNMGVHFVNLNLIGPEPDPMAPQILMYEPHEGKLRLAGVEWFIPLATGVKERPELYGHAFEGPMEGHEPLLPKDLHHYDLHVWLFKENPNGLFHHSNPDVSCDGAWHYSVKEAPPPHVPHN